MLRKFTTCTKGATGTEYAIIAAFLSIAIVTGLTLLGEDAVALFEALADIFNNWRNRGNTP